MIEGVAGGVAGVLALGALILWQRGMLVGYSPQLALLLAAFALAGALAGWILVRLLKGHVSGACLARCTSTILPGEMVVLAEVKASETARVVAILGDVEAEAPVTFAFHSPPPFEFKSSARPLGHELPSGQRLAENAALLAGVIPVSREAKTRGFPLLLRLRESERILIWTDASLTMSAEVHHAFTLSRSGCSTTPISSGTGRPICGGASRRETYGRTAADRERSEAGLPRVYRWRRKSSRERRRARAGDHPEISDRFPGVAPLDIAELWALPLMLRLQLLECLRSLAIQVEQQQSQSEEADFWANRLITAGRHGSPRLLRDDGGTGGSDPEPTRISRANWLRISTTKRRRSRW